MGRVQTNFVSLAYAIETTLGVVDSSTQWKLLEPNGISSFGAEITTTPRDPISKNRQRQKGAVTDLDSSIEYEADLTIEQFTDFIEGFLFVRATGGAVLDGTVLKSGADFNSLAAELDPPPAGTDSGFSHDSLSAPLPIGTLVFARGFTLAANNGLTDVITGSTVDDTLVSKTLADETPTQVQNASLEIAGHRAATSDLALTVSGTTATLTSSVLDFTTLNIKPGQLLHVGGLTSGEQFSAGAGFARAVTIAANLLNLDKLDATLLTDDGTGDTVDLLFGRFIRNVPVDDADFQERSYQFEGAYPNLADPGPGDEFEYPKGNLANTAAFNLPLTDKATVTFGFIGTDTEPPTGSRKTNADTPIEPVMKGAFNTSSDIARLRITEIDETGLTTDFSSLSLTLNNNVTPEKVLGQLGARFMNTGNLNVDIEAQVVFSNGAVPAAIRNNTTVTMDFTIKNDDGMLAVDLPAMDLGGGDKEFTVNESVRLNVTGLAFEDAVLGTSIGVSIFPVVP